VVIQYEEALYQVYAPLPLPSPFSRILILTCLMQNVSFLRVYCAFLRTGRLSVLVPMLVAKRH